MLTVTRRNAESIQIVPAADLDPAMTVAELFKDSHIEIHLNKITNGSVAVSISAPDELDLLRSELLDHD